LFRQACQAQLPSCGSEMEVVGREGPRQRIRALLGLQLAAAPVCSAPALVDLGEPATGLTKAVRQRTLSGRSWATLGGHKSPPDPAHGG